MPVSRFFCRHCNSITYDLRVMRAHCRENHRIDHPGKADFETALEKEARERYEREMMDAAYFRKVAVIEFEVEAAKKDLRKVDTVADFLAASKGE